MIEKYCYDNDPNNCTTYGGFYQWNEAMQYVTTLGAQGICPSGWHIPTLSELQTLNNAVSGNGNSLKAIGQGSGSGAGTNTSGFSALLAGSRLNPGWFSSLGYTTNFWSSTEHNTGFVYDMFLGPNGSYVYFYNDLKEEGMSVRCIKD